MWHPLDCSSFTNYIITFRGVLSAFAALLFFFFKTVYFKFGVMYL